jgi:hypothetical protein
VVVAPRVLQLCPWGNQVAQFVTIDASSFQAIAKSLQVGVATVEAPEVGKLAPFIVRTGWRNVKFFHNMGNRIEAGTFACPRSIRSDGYRLQVT